MVKFSVNNLNVNNGVEKLPYRYFYVKCIPHSHAQVLAKFIAKYNSKQKLEVIKKHEYSKRTVNTFEFTERTEHS